jgi:FMN phosphatase YigB (HAD superfamily)
MLHLSSRFRYHSGMIEVVYLDLGKVLIDFDYAVAAQRLLEISPLPLSEITKVLSEPQLLFESETGKLSAIEYYKIVCGALEMQVSLDEFRSLWGSMFLPEPLVSEKFLQELKQKKRLILLSNTNEIHFEYIEENFPILKQIEERVLSYRVGYMKPDPQIFQLAIEKAGVAPEKIFFADDRIENIEGARRAGIQAVQFKSERQLRQELIDRGIEC